MAISTESFSKEVVGTLDVVPIYQELMAASTATDSAYLKAKETLTAIFEEGSFTTTEKSNILAQTIANIATGITSTAMNAAVAIAKENRDAPYVLAKLREDTILVQEQQNKLATDIDNADEDLKSKVYMGWKVQAELYRDYGVLTWNQSTVTDIIPQAGYDNTYGIKVETMKKARADLYQGYAQGFRTNGYVSVVVNADGSIGDTTTADLTGLSYWQTRVAERQKTAFDDNMKQHVANSSASFMSTLLATEASGIDYLPYLAKWTTAIDYLNTP